MVEGSGVLGRRAGSDLTGIALENVEAYGAELIDLALKTKG